MNVLTPTLQRTMLFVNHIPSDILCCSILIIWLMQRALQGWCGPVQSTWETSLGEDKLGAIARILNTKVVRRVRAGQLGQLFPL